MIRHRRIDASRGGLAAAPSASWQGRSRVRSLAAALAMALAACSPTVRDAAPAPPPDPPPPPLDLPCGDGCGELALRLVLGEPGPFAALIVRPYWGGANDELSRALGWTGFSGRPDAVVLHPRVPVLVARGPLAAGRWNRVFAAALEVRGRLRSGRRVRVANHIEPIARGFDLAPGQRVTVDVELVVLDAPGNAPTYEAFVRDARLVAAPRAP